MKNMRRGAALCIAFLLAGGVCARQVPDVRASEAAEEALEMPKASELSGTDAGEFAEEAAVPLEEGQTEVPQTAEEAAQAETLSGGYGSNSTWTLNLSSGTLTISGSGDMATISGGTLATTPWSSYKDSVKIVVIENGITNISVWAFSGHSNLEEVTIPDTMTLIPSGAFSGCSSLREVVLPDSITTIENNVFMNCSSLEKVVLPDSITTIKGQAFDGCSSLEEIVLPDSITSIGAHAFRSCSSLRKIVLPDSITAIEFCMFRDCSSLEEIVLPDGITSIGAYAFDGCSSLREIKIPSHASWGSGAFRDCESLQKVSLGDGMERIVSAAFKNCKSLTDIDIPSTVASIEYDAFSGCSSLPEVTIPAAVSKIEGGAFTDCSALKNVYFLGNAPEFSAERDDYYDPESIEPFTNVAANVYRPVGDATWTAENMLDYGGKLTWVGNGPSEGLKIVPEATDKGYSIGSGSGTVIKCTAPLEGFVSLAVDGVIVAPSNYTAVSGSTVITLLPSYLDTLAVGDHRVTLNYVFGSVDTTLMVLERGSAQGAGGTNGSGGTDGSGTSGKEGNGAGSLNSPKTGEASGYEAWFAAILAVCCVCVVLLRTRKGFHGGEKIGHYKIR